MIYLLLVEGGGRGGGRGGGGVVLSDLIMNNATGSATPFSGTE